MIDFREVPRIAKILNMKGFDLQPFEDSKHTFYIAGSFYFLTFNLFSDLDFIVSSDFDPNDLDDCMVVRGQYNDYYLDDMTDMVCRTTYNPGCHIDIQVCKEGMLDKKLYISKLIRDFNLQLPIRNMSNSKKHVSNLWVALSKLYDAGDGCDVPMAKPRVTVVPKEKPVHTCPLCGSNGVDMAGLAFYCTNKGCSNYRP
jgi:hypothetical protein